MAGMKKVTDWNLIYSNRTWEDKYLWRVLSSGMWRRLVWYKYTDVSDEPAASIIRIGANMQVICRHMPGDTAVSTRNVTNSGRPI